MARLKDFSFGWGSLWLELIHDGWGYYISLYESENEIGLDVKADKDSYKIDLTNKEDEFIDFLERCNVKNWDKKKYINFNVFDGYNWHLDVSYDNREIHSNGTNGYPPSFELFINELHQKWGLVMAKIDSQENFDLKEEINGTEIIENDN